MPWIQKSEFCKVSVPVDSVSPPEGTEVSVGEILLLTLPKEETEAQGDARLVRQCLGQVNL